MSTFSANQDLLDSAPSAATETPCTHCGLPVPQGLIEQDAEHQFCCSGCRTVYSIISDKGLDRYYDMRRSLESDKAPALASDKNKDTDYAALDDPALLELYTTTLPDGTTEATLTIEGLHCPACVWLIERLGRVVPGIISASVNFGRSSVTVRWDPARSKFSDIARGLHALGYPASPPRGASNDRARKADARAQLVRIGVAGALMGNVMLVSVALYAGVFEHIDPALFTMFRWVAAVLGTLSLLFPGRVFFRGALGAVRTRTPHLDIPIALALAFGTIAGLVSTVRGSGEIYFDSLTALIFLLLVGRFIQSQQQRRAADAVDMLLTLTPSLVRVVKPDGTTETRPAESVQPGDTALIHAGETVPIDGVITQGSSELDQAILTGESAPVPASINSEVWAGTVNLSSTISVRIVASGAATRAARLMQLVSDAAARKAPIVQLADRIAGWFVVVVSILAACTAIAWAFIDPERAVTNATALLIVTCPCALGLATPLVLSVTIGRLAKQGILVKGGQQLEKLAKPGSVILDKTGTVTRGVMSVVHATVPEDTLLRARALEAYSTHPIAKAIATSGDQCPNAPTTIEQIQGQGIRGTVDGHTLVIGYEALLLAQQAEIPDDVRVWSQESAQAGLTPVLVAEDGTAVGGIALRDEPRQDAPALIESLHASGWQTSILSGDDQRVVTSAAASIGIDPKRAHGRVSPEGKLQAVRKAVQHAAREAQGDTPVVMIGDGVNDAAALAASDVGIAVQGGADASLDAADISIQTGELDSVQTLLDTARAAMRRIRLCIGVSVAYNLIAATLAVTGLVGPLTAAVLMPISSLSVVMLATPRRKGA